MDQNLINYLQTNKDKYSVEALKEALLNAGYMEYSINDAINFVYGNANIATSIPPAQNTGNFSPIQTPNQNAAIQGNNETIQFSNWSSDLLSKYEYWDLIFTNKGVLFLNLGKAPSILFAFFGLIIYLILDMVQRDKRKEIRAKLQSLDYGHLMMLDFEKIEIPNNELGSRITFKKRFFYNTISLKMENGKTRKFIWNKKINKNLIDFLKSLGIQS